MNKTKLLTGVLVISFFLIFSDAVSAKGGRGGRSSGGSSRSTSTTTSRTTTTTKSNPAPAPKPNPNKPSSTTKTVTNSTPKTVNGKTYSSKGNVVDDNYRPSFRGGYTAPSGSVVYYRDNSWLDYLPLYFLLTHNSHPQAIVQQPDGQEKVVEEEGVDSMYVINWIITILFAIGLIGLVIWIVNKMTRKGVDKYAY